MNKIIKEQLKKVTATNIQFTDDTQNIFIPKTIKIINSSLKKGDVYLIHLFDSVANPSSSSTLASNWNAGKVPKNDTYIAEIINNMSKMIKVNGVSVVDDTDNFYGWLPYDGFEVLEKC